MTQDKIKRYSIKGNASKEILKVWCDEYGEKISFFCIFSTKKEAEMILKSVGDGCWHIEEGI